MFFHINTSESHNFTIFYPYAPKFIPPVESWKWGIFFSTWYFLGAIPIDVVVRSMKPPVVMMVRSEVWSALEVFPGTPDELFSGLEALKWSPGVPNVGDSLWDFKSAKSAIRNRGQLWKTMDFKMIFQYENPCVVWISSSFCLMGFRWFRWNGMTKWTGACKI